MDLARDFAGKGYIGFTGCWFEGNHFRGGGAGPPEPIDCPGGPEYRGVSATSAWNAITLLGAAKRLEDADPERIGLWGQSRGASMSLVLASSGADVKAVVAAAAGYTELPGRRETPPMNFVRDLDAPVLLLHGTADQIVPVQQAKEYAEALAMLGKPHETHYFSNAPHGLAFSSNTKVAALSLAVEFFKRHLN